MSSHRGVIALMGSGELTASMVGVHRSLITNFPVPPRAVFMDTPAGFQLNVDQLSRRACEFFRVHLQHPMDTASFRSSACSTPYERERAFQTLREADFVLIGPGSPTYAVRQWRETPIPDILIKRIEAGACLVAASAAALTVGRFTLPVYEIYKVGENLHWVEGINILGPFGFNLVVIPHWNNAEGGTHDTRFCYMGEPRFRKLESLLPDEVTILGLDEHTACLIDLEQDEALVRGIGRVTLRSRGAEMTFEKGEQFPLEILRGSPAQRAWGKRTPGPPDTIPGRGIAPTDRGDARAGLPGMASQDSFWEKVHSMEKTFQASLDRDDAKEATNALLELDWVIWKAQQDLESEEFISQAREILRELIVLLGLRLESVPKDTGDLLEPLVERLLEVREGFRESKRWEEADQIRETLHHAGIIVEDTKSGPRWRLASG